MVFDGHIFFDGWASIGRTVVSGISAYLLLVLFLRLSGKRTLSKMNAFDFVVTVALGSLLATMLVSKTVPVATGCAALLTLIALQYILTWLSVRSSLVRRLSRSEPKLLLRDGQFLESAMRQERVNREEILGAMRKHGVIEVAGVGAIILETDGKLTVISTIPTSGPAALKDVAGWQ